MSGSLLKLRQLRSTRRVRLSNYSSTLTRQRPPAFTKTQGRAQFKVPDLQPTNWWNNWWNGNGGGTSGGLKSVYIGEVPDPHVDLDCLRDMIEGYATVHYYNFAYESMTGGDASDTTDKNWQVNSDKLPGMTGGSPCTQFGRDLATFEIDNWDTVCELLGEGFSNERMFNLISLFKGEKHQRTDSPLGSKQNSNTE